MADSHASTILAIIFWVLALAGGLLATLMMLVMCLAGAPNSTPEQSQFIKQLMIGFALTGVLSAVGAIVLLVLKLPWWGVGVGALPIAVMIVATIIAFTRSG